MLNPIFPRFKLQKLQLLEWLATLLIGFFIFIPAVGALCLSFMTKTRNAPARLPLTFEHYRALLTIEYHYCLLRAFMLATCAVVLCNLICYPLIFFLRKKQVSAGWSWTLTLSFIPFTTNSLFRIYGLQQVLTWLNKWQSAWLQEKFPSIFPIQLLYSPFAVVLGLISLLFPFVFVPLWLSAQRIPTSQLEAARDLGARDHQIFWNIIYPLTAQARWVGFTMSFLPAVGMFYVSDFLGGGKQVLWGNILRGQLFQIKNPALASATCCLLFFYLACAFLLGRLFRKFKTCLLHRLSH